MDILHDQLKAFLLQQTSSVTWSTGAIAFVLVAFQLHKYRKHQKLKFLRDYGTEPTYRPLMDPLSAPGIIFGSGLGFFWDKRSTLFQKVGKTIITLEPTVWGSPIMSTNSLPVVRQIVGSSWRKPDWVLETVSFWGHNLLSSQLDEGWRRHRRILQPAFNNKLYEDVWNESMRLCNGMFDTNRFPTTPGAILPVPNMCELTTRFTLCVILACGFGYPLAWDERLRTPDNDVTIDEGMAHHSENLILLTYAPQWLFKLPVKKLQYIDRVTKAMRTWFKEAAATKKREVAAATKDGEDVETEHIKRDIFTRLALASQTEGKYHLDDDELIGMFVAHVYPPLTRVAGVRRPGSSSAGTHLLQNVWVQMFAGHETSASALASCLCFLAVHKREQDIIHEEIQTLLKNTADGKLTFEHYEQLIKTRSAFVEAVRLCPPANLIIREARDDCILQATQRGPSGSFEPHNVMVPKGAIMVVDFIGMHYDPEVFPNPTEFQPSRWYTASTDEAYSQFSTGPRVCIGRRFALVESVAFLCNILKDYEVRPLLNTGESVDAWSKRVLQKVECRLTMTLAHTPLAFQRRG